MAASTMAMPTAQAMPLAAFAFFSPVEAWAVEPNSTSSITSAMYSVAEMAFSFSIS